MTVFIGWALGTVTIYWNVDFYLIQNGVSTIEDYDQSTIYNLVVFTTVGYYLKLISSSVSHQST